MRYRSEYPLRPVREYPAPEARRTERVRSSHAAIPVALVLFGFGLYLGTITVIFPALLGFLLLVVGGSLLATRINPLSVGFYLTRKPSWLAIGTIFLSALGLFFATYYYVVHGLGPVVPSTWSSRL